MNSRRLSLILTPLPRTWISIGALLPDGATAARSGISSPTTMEESRRA
jgi:hypothetical protein